MKNLMTDSYYEPLVFSPSEFRIPHLLTVHFPNYIDQNWMYLIFRVHIFWIGWNENCFVCKIETHGRWRFHYLLIFLRNCLRLNRQGVLKNDCTRYDKQTNLINNKLELTSRSFHRCVKLAQGKTSWIKSENEESLKEIAMESTAVT